MRELNFNSGVGGVKTLSYTYDANGNIKTVKEGSSEIASYEYDGLNRLTRENIAGEKTVVYTYDAGGNLKTKKEYAYTKSATLGTVKDTFNYTYASGTWGDRLTKYDVGSIQYNEAGYPTMYRGHVLSWEKGNLQYFDNTDFIYNDSGIRIAKGSTDYFVKGNQILAEKRGSTVIHYYYDDSGVAGFEYNGQKYVYRKNLQGDIVAILDECGCTRGTYEYDAWGNIIWQGGSELLTINPFRYRGYYYDEETGLYYLNSRYYDPETGRFISPDSLKYLEPETCNGLNLYAYCGNNPVMFVDPNGCFAISTFIIGLLATVGGLTIAGAAIGGISAAIHQENILTGIRNGAIAGLLFGMSAALVATGVGTPLAGGFIGTLMVGMGVGSAYVLGSSLNSQLQGKGFGRIEIGEIAIAWATGAFVGGLAAGFSYAFSSLLSIYGEMFGAALAGKTFLGIQLSKIISIGTSIELGGLIGGAVGGSLAGKIINNAAMDSGFISSALPLWLINLLKKLF